MKLQKIDWTKLKNFFLGLIGGKIIKLNSPVECRINKKNEDSLLGKAYYFCILKNWKIKSPLEGIVSKIYPNQAIQITNQEGLQILIDIQTDKKNPVPLNKIFECQVVENQKIDSKTTLFIVYLEEGVISVSIYIPGQPEIISKVESLKNSNYFAKIHYRNPYSKLKFKRHGKYFQW